MKKILVIGSNSFSGSNFVSNALNEGFEVIGVSRSKQLDPVFKVIHGMNKKIFYDNKNKLIRNFFLQNKLE